MVAIFCRVTAELSLDFLVNFPNHFDLHGMLSRICKDMGVNISFQNETFLLHGDWTNIQRTHSVLASTLAMYGNTSPVYKEHTDISHSHSRPFSALVEAAEALSRGVDLQQQIRNDFQMNEQTESYPPRNFSSNYNNYNGNGYQRAASSRHGSVNNEEIDQLKYSSQNLQTSTDKQNSYKCTDTVLICQQQEASTEPQLTPSRVNDLAEAVKTKNKDPNSDLKPTNNSNESRDSVLKSKIEDGDVTAINPISICSSSEVLEDKKTVYLENDIQFCGKPMVKCDTCDKIFASVSNLKRHMLRHKAVSYKCEECCSKYKDLTTLREHLKVHVKGYVKPEFKCESCQKSFCSVYLKECHFKSEHLGMKKLFLCQTCGKSFTTNKTLEQHVNGHNGIKPYRCSVCEKCFSYESALNDHYLIHFVEKKFVCKYQDCKKAFRQRSALKMHEKIHIKPNQFECSECGRGFTQKQALQRHIRSHKGLKPFRCKYCGRNFGDASIIRRHLKLVHKLSKDVDKWREDVIIVNIKDTESDRASTTSDSGQTEVSISETVQTIEESNFSQDAENIRPSSKDSSSQIMNSESEMNTESIQNVFVTFNMPSQNLVLETTASSEYHENSTELMQMNYKSTESVSNSVIKSGTYSSIEVLKSKQEDGSESLSETDSVFIEREPIQLLTENLDGTFDTTLDFSKLKRNLELLTKPSSSVDISMSNDQTADILKPDGTEAELPLNSSPESMARFGDLETLSDSLGLTVSQFQSCYYNLGNHYQPN